MGDAPHGELEPIAPVATLSASDARFMEWFEEAPELNTLANNRAMRFIQKFDEILEQATLTPTAQTADGLHFELKKLVFLFTDPDDLEDTITEEDAGMLFTGLYTRSGLDIGAIPTLFNDFARAASEVHIPKLVDTLFHWEALTQPVKFWMVCGAAFCAVADVPIQKRRTSA